nr:hypothetical protein CFP56_55935 [Quercus suber]
MYDMADAFAANAKRNQTPDTTNTLMMRYCTKRTDDQPTWDPARKTCWRMRFVAMRSKDVQENSFRDLRNLQIFRRRQTYMDRPKTYTRT